MRRLHYGTSTHIKRRLARGPGLAIPWAYLKKAADDEEAVVLQESVVLGPVFGLEMHQVHLQRQSVHKFHHTMLFKIIKNSSKI